MSHPFVTQKPTLFGFTIMSKEENKKSMRKPFTLRKSLSRRSQLATHKPYIEVREKDRRGEGIGDGSRKGHTCLPSLPANTRLGTEEGPTPSRTRRSGARGSLPTSVRTNSRRVSTLMVAKGPRLPFVGVRVGGTCEFRHTGSRISSKCHECRECDHP